MPKVSVTVIIETDTDIPGLVAESLLKNLTEWGFRVAELEAHPLETIEFKMGQCHDCKCTHILNPKGLCSGCRRFAGQRTRA